MEYVFHRLLRLFTCLGIDDVMHLFGPFYRLDEHVVDDNLAHQNYFDTPLSPARAKALWRCEKLIQLSSSSAVEACPKDARVPYLLGLCIQANLRIVFDDTIVTMSDVYRKGMAPEQLELSDLWVVERVTNRHDLCEILWSTFFGVGIDWRTGKQQSVDNVPCIRILSKGMPNPTSIRYIGDQLSTELQNEKSPYTMKCALMCGLLGAYEHTNRVPPLPVFMWAFSRQTGPCSWKESVIDLLNSREVYALLCEFVISLTHTHSALRHALELLPSWESYQASCTGAMETIIRKRMWTFLSETNASRQQQPGIGRSYYNKYKIGMMETKTLSMVKLHLPLFASILGVKTRISAATIESLGGVEPTRTLFNAAMQRLGSQTLPAEFLYEFGVSKESWKVFLDMSQQCDLRHNKRMTRALSKLSKRDRGVLTVVVRALLEKLRLSVTINHKARHHGVSGRNLYSILCTRCMSMRTRSRGLGKVSEMGVLLDMTQRHCVRCSSCRSDQNLRCVDVTKWIISAPSPCSKYNIASIVCCHCSVPVVSSQIVYFQDKPICRHCNVKAIAEEKTRKTCFVGCILKTKPPATSLNFVAINEKGCLQSYCSCDRHKRFVPSSGFHPITTILKLTGSV